MTKLSDEQRQALENEITSAIALKFEGQAEAWMSDNSGDHLARIAAEAAVRVIAERITV